MSGVTPPQPIAEFPDHPYIRGEDIIRPKPRRLVDMRRFPPGSPPSKMEGLSLLNSSASSSSFANQLPPILPVKPAYGSGSGGGNHSTPSDNSNNSNNNSPHYFGKPRSFSTNDSPGTGGMITSPKSHSNKNSGNVHNSPQSRPQSHSPLYLPMTQNPHYYPGQSPGQGGASPSKSFLKGFVGLNQRSVPNLPQLLGQPLGNNNMYTPTPTPAHQLPARSHSSGGPNHNNSPQRRLFLSPQPNDSTNNHNGRNLPNNPSLPAFGGSSGNLLNNNEEEEEEDNGNVPYYSELTTLSPPKSSPSFMPAHIAPFSGGQGQSHGSGPQGWTGAQNKPPRVRVEWKSVDNLQKHNGPRLTMATHNDIDINSPPQHVYNSPVHGTGFGCTNKGESFQMSHPPTSSTPLGFVNYENHSKRVERPEKSPEYDRIKTPHEIAQEMKKRFAAQNQQHHQLSVQYVEPDPPPQKNFINASPSPNKGVGHSLLNYQQDCAVTEIMNNTLNTSFNEAMGKIEPNPDSLGRSSTSDGDFGTMGDSMYTANAGSTPSARNKSRHIAPSSKLKSRRKNILHNLSNEEMKLLSSGGGPDSQGGLVNSTNTGTGGSSSDGSSGHASMSDSQTSGSPPAEYVTSSGIPGVPPTNNSASQTSPGTSLTSSGYKSLLKSVPEDETNNTSGSASGINSTSTTNTIIPSNLSGSRLPLLGSSDNSKLSSEIHEQVARETLIDWLEEVENQKVPKQDDEKRTQLEKAANWRQKRAKKMTEIQFSSQIPGSSVKGYYIMRNNGRRMVPRPLSSYYRGVMKFANSTTTANRNKSYLEPDHSLHETIKKSMEDSAKLRPPLDIVYTSTLFPPEEMRGSLLETVLAIEPVQSGTLEDYTGSFSGGGKGQFSQRSDHLIKKPIPSEIYKRTIGSTTPMMCIQKKVALMDSESTKELAEGFWMESILLSNGNSGLEDIKQAIEQLTLRSHHGGGGHHGTGHHSSYSTSTYSSMSGSECDNRHRRPHLIRYSSLDTINTQVTSADEFVWVDSSARLVELQHIPWSNHDILKVVEKSSKLRDNLERISMETVPRVSCLLQRALVRVARETQRLAKPSGFCSKQEVSTALKVVLSPALADSSSKACLRAAAMFSVSTSDPLHRESKSARAGLNLHVGRFHRWMIDVRLGRFVHEFAAIHLAASMENLIEEVLGQSLNHIAVNSDDGTNPILTAALLEQAIANNGDLWGLLQPYAHLNAGRTASGALALPRRWASVASVNSSGSSSSTIGPSPHDDSSLSSRSHNHSKSLEQSLLTTCVGSIVELSESLSLVSRVHYKQLPLSTTNNGSKAIPPSWSPSATHTLFYFMRCSQLENSEDRLGSNTHLGSSTATLGGTGDNVHEKSQHHGATSTSARSGGPTQELVYERPFIVLPPLIEWVRVAAAHADHRHSGIVDKDDVMQAARLLLPGIDCPVRFVGCDEFFWPRRTNIDEFECNRRLKIDLAFKMLTSGRSDLVAQALLLMPPSKANTFNEAGLSPLILGSIRNEEGMIRVLLEAGADVDAECPPNGPNFSQANGETPHWTPLTYSALMGHSGIVKVLLEKNANVEGGAKLSEEKSTQTPLQVASANGNMDIVSSLLSYGANPFLSTLVRDSLCYTGSAQRGSFSAISVAASHGQRAILHKLLSHPFNQPFSKEVLSLEEILAEGAQPLMATRKEQLLPGQMLNNQGRPEEPKILSKAQVKVLQEAMYQSAENGHLEITLDLRNMGVPWTLHCWINSLATSHELRCEPVIDQLLQDFLQILPNEDFSQASFVDDCLPLLFTIFRNSKNEGTTLLLADIFQTCYGRDSIKEIRDTSISNGTRIDPKYVNNQELSDVQFRVEGRAFYSHKIVLVTSSQRFKSMLKSATDSNPPVLQINDIRYPIFQMVMEYLYNGNCDCIRHIEANDVLELMAAANFFQLDGLLRFCESRCSQKLNIESIVSMYIHGKVYNAVQLLEYCQGFLLQNMVALLTFDDSVRRLIFGKKLHNHDVLAGLLLTLQARLKSGPTSNSSRKSK